MCFLKGNSSLYQQVNTTLSRPAVTVKSMDDTRSLVWCVRHLAQIWEKGPFCHRNSFPLVAQVGCLEISKRRIPDFTE
ncbi:hypothetical protein MHYP_G00229030 [Metynnis hypsauchen]